MKKALFILLFPFLTLWGGIPEKKEVKAEKEIIEKRRFELKVAQFSRFGSVDCVILAK